MVSFKRILQVLVLTMAALPACADTLNVVANGSIGSHAGEGSGGFYMTTYADSSTLQVFGSPQTGSTQAVLDIPQFTLPADVVVTSATLTVSFDPLVQERPTRGTYSEGPQSVDHSHSFTPGAIRVTTSTATSLLGLSASSPTPGSSSCSLSAPGSSVNLLAAGFSSCLTGTGDYFLALNSETTLTAALVSSGFNAWEIFNFEGGNTVDVTADLSIDYTADPPAPAPEPSGVVLLGTGMLALMAGAWRRRSAGCCDAAS
jgi:hypothetical protein